MQVVGLGAGGHAKVVIEILELMGEHELVGLLDPRRDLWNTRVHGINVLGDDDLLPELHSQGVRAAFVGIGSVKDTRPRLQLYNKARYLGFLLVKAIHPQAVVSSSALIGDGPTIMAGAVVNASAKLGDNVIVNTGAIVEHDCIIGHHAHIATGAKLAATVNVGEGAHIGAGATVRQSINIGLRAIVGAGSVVVDDVIAESLVVGVPARPLNNKDRKAFNSVSGECAG